MTAKNKTPIAKDIITQCKKCNLELNHVVLLHKKDGTVSKVKCHTCGSEHKFYPDKKKSPAKKTPAAAKKKKQTKKHSVTKYNQLIEQHNSKKIIPYSISEGYSVNDIIEHKVFGKGIVTETSSQKMDVLFEDSVRLMACNR